MELNLLEDLHRRGLCVLKLRSIGQVSTLEGIFRGFLPRQDHRWYHDGS